METSFGQDFSKVRAGEALRRLEWGLVGGEPGPSHTVLQKAPPKAPPATPTLKKKTVSGPTATNCGGFSWGCQWSLDNPDKTNGFIVQHVTFTVDVKDTAGKAVDGPKSLGLDPMWLNYWEAWQVKSGSVFVGISKEAHSADTFQVPALGDGTKGSITEGGSADYYPDLALPKAFTVRDAAPAWSLPITDADPALKGGTGSVAHKITASWDCTPTSKDKRTKLATT